MLLTAIACDAGLRLRVLGDVGKTSYLQDVAAFLLDRIFSRTVRRKAKMGHSLPAEGTGVRFRSVSVSVS